MKKGQMEIMGIAVVMILIFFGFLFYIRFTTTFADNTSSQKKFQQATMASYVINSILETSIAPGACDIEGQLKDLVSDCVRNAGCDTAAINCIRCGAQTSCEFLESTISANILAPTLDVQERKYSMTIGTREDVYVTVDPGDPCIEVRNFEEFPLASGELIGMSLCER